MTRAPDVDMALLMSSIPLDDWFGTAAAVRLSTDEVWRPREVAAYLALHWNDDGVPCGHGYRLMAHSEERLSKLTTLRQMRVYVAASAISGGFPDSILRKRQV